MPADLRTYLKLVRAGFAKQAHYRLAMLAGLGTNLVFGFIRAAILFAAVTSAGGSLGGYTVGTISSYVWLSQGLLGAIELSGRAEVGDRVRTGDVAVDFIRPVDLQTWHLAEDMGRAAYTLIPRGLPSVLVGALTVGLVLPRTPLPYLLGLVSVVAGVAISFYCRYAVNVLGFWLLDTRGVRTLYTVTSTFLAGLFVPVSLFPSWLHTVAYWTPFPSILQIPVNVLSGRDAGVDAAAALLMQGGWLIAVCLVGRALTNAGRRQLVLNGG
ncbi:MAG: ABC transporter permease [Nocardioidaceae bacterium]